MSSRPDGYLVCLGLGSNIEPQENLRKAMELLRQSLRIEAVSSAWETPAVGSAGPDFLNAAVLVRTSLSPHRLKEEVIRPAESRLGRTRSADKNAPRPIDIDILIFDSHLVDPHLWRQAFLAVPVSELLPDYSCPETGETIAQAAARLSHHTRIRRALEFSPNNPGAYDLS